MTSDPRPQPAVDQAFDEATEAVESYAEMSVEDQVARMAGEGGVATEIPHRRVTHANPPEHVSDDMPSE
jgi:hypothetical protein